MATADYRSSTGPERPMADPKGGDHPDFSDVPPYIRELAGRMTPEKRELFREIMVLREKIGEVGINVVETLREMREDG